MLTTLLHALLLSAPTPAPDASPDPQAELSEAEPSEAEAETKPSEAETESDPGARADAGGDAATEPAPSAPDPSGPDGAIEADAPLIDDSPPEPRPVRFALGVLGGGGYGWLLAPSGMLALRFAVFGKHWRWSLRGGWLPPVRVQAQADPSVRARIDGVMVAMRGCGLIHAGPIEFPLCGGLEGGAARARTLASAASPDARTIPYFGLELGPGITYSPIPRIGLCFEVKALVPILSSGLALSGVSVVDKFPVGVRALAGVELRLP